MKKIVTWLTVISIIVFLIDWGVMGIKILDNDYNITAEAYIGAFCILILLFCLIYRIFSTKCPHCKKLLLQKVKYCPHCGKEIK